MTTRFVRVYHLLSADNALDDIKEQFLKVATYKDLNDPFELSCADLSNKDFRRALNGFKQEFSNRGLLCFSRTWENPVLWSHYADKHKGIALGFDIPIELATPVLYSPSRLTIDHTQLTESVVQQMLHTKFSHWAYEDEIRVHVTALDKVKRRGDLYFYEFDENLTLREVILGPLSTQKINQVRELVKSFTPIVKVTQARLAFKTFKVVTNQRHNIYKSS
jgi:hypothetical protein